MTLGIALRFARRHRAALAVAAVLAMAAVVAIAAAVLFARVKEGWTFQQSGSEDMSDDHRALIIKHCGRGLLVSDLRSRDKWSFLGKYDRRGVRELCDSTRQAAVEEIAKFANDPQRTKDLRDQCKKGKRSICPEPELRYKYPCRAKTSAKCCDYDGKNCVFRGKAGNLTPTDDDPENPPPQE